MKPWNKGKTYTLRHIRRGKYIICKYKYCKKEFYAYPYEAEIRLYCSPKCSNKATAKKLSQSRIGRGNPMYGKRPWNFKDGKSRKRGYDMRYWTWRRKVLQRDKQTCQNCFDKLKRKDCVAHHIKPWAKYPKLRFVVSNGITYCRPCHNKIDPLVKATQY